MIGVDTNLLVRYLLRDDEEQSPRAKAVMDGFTDVEPGYISLVTLIETMWLLKRSYKIPRDNIIQTVLVLAASSCIRLQEEDAVEEAIEIARKENCDLPDALVSIFGREAGCAYTLTFDRRATRIPGMVLV